MTDETLTPQARRDFARRVADATMSMRLTIDNYGLSDDLLDEILEMADEARREQMVSSLPDVQDAINQAWTTYPDEANPDWKVSLTVDVENGERRESLLAVNERAAIILRADTADQLEQAVREVVRANNARANS